MTDDNTVLVERDGPVTIVSINRPERRNAVDGLTARKLYDTFRAFDADDSASVAVFTGVGGHFCAGADLKAVAAGDVNKKREIGGHDSIAPMGPSRLRLSKPVIGAINGVAITGGLELALACDFLVASEQARFADTHSRVGIQPGWGLTVDLPAAVGVRRAKEMSATGNFVDAATALTWGLVNHVVAHDELLPSCRRLAADIASNDQAGVARLLQTYDEGALGTRAEAITLEGRVSRAWLAGKGDAAAEVEARRQAIVDRGRGQAG